MMNKERKTPPSHESIVMAQDGKVPWFDWYEPSCMACTKHRVKKDDGNSSKTINQVWKEHTYLEKAHIVPHSLNGDNAPENYLLLCVDCHRESPDTINPAIMYNWVENRDTPMGAMIKELNKQLDDFKINKEHILAPSKKELTSSIGTHNGDVKNSSIVGAIVSHNLTGKNPTT